MAIAKTVRKRPNQMLIQQHIARHALKTAETKLAPTFPRKTTAYDSATRRFQKRRFNVHTLFQMLNSQDPVLKKLAIDRIAHSNPKIIQKIGLPDLQKLAKDDNQLVRRVAIAAITEIYNRMGINGLPFLKEMTKDDGWYACYVAANAIRHPFRRTEKRYACYVAANAMARICVRMGKRGLPYLKEMTKDSNSYVRQVAARAMTNNLDERKATAKTTQNTIEKKLLLSSRRPVAATAHLPEILRRAKTLNQISLQLKREFKEGFTGIVVFGSMAKGYAKPESDVDYAIIASNPTAAKRFREISEKNNLPLCKEHYVNPNENNPSNSAPLFYGLFFGNRKALRKAQQNAFTHMNNEQWNNLRNEIFENEANLKKTFERLGITSKREQQRLKAAAALRVPPPYNEMKQLLGLEKTTTKRIRQKRAK